MAHLAQVSHVTSIQLMETDSEVKAELTNDLFMSMLCFRSVQFMPQCSINQPSESCLSWFLKDGAFTGFVYFSPKTMYYFSSFLCFQVWLAQI